MKYKVGDKVRIKSINWYNENKDDYGNVDCGAYSFTYGMTKFCGKIVTIRHCYNHGCYTIKEDDHDYTFTIEMIEGLMEDDCGCNDNYCEATKYIIEENYDSIKEKKLEFDYEKAMNELIGFDIENACMNHEFDAFNRAVSEHGYNSKEALIRKFFIMLRKNGTAQYVLENIGFELPEGYTFKDDNGNVINAQKIVLEKKKPKYPKTYEKCLNVLGYEDIATHCIFHTEADEKLFNTLYDLKVCRDAYWKIAGEEMGLGKPWEPTTETVYCISRNDNIIKCSYRGGKSNILEFPTAEMRDAFYENFKDLIECCKELL